MSPLTSAYRLDLFFMFYIGRMSKFKRRTSVRVHTQLMTCTVHIKLKTFMCVCMCLFFYRPMLVASLLLEC